MKLSSRNKALLPGVIFIVLGIIFFLRFGAIILVLTIIPSIFAFFVDRNTGKPAFRVIAACNLSAAIPFIIPIVDYSLQEQYADAGKVLESPLSWAFIYCGAGAGWGMLYLSRVVARVVTLMHYEYSIGVLQKKQAILVKEWGEEVAAPEAKAKNIRKPEPAALPPPTTKVFGVK